MKSMVAMPVANLPRLGVALAGTLVTLVGSVIVAIAPDTRLAGLVVLGLALVARAIWWERGGQLLAPHRIPLVLACLVIVGMFTANRDMGHDYDHARGDGHYRPVLARGDGHMMYLMARSTALDGDWVFDNDLARFGDPWNQPRTKTGRKSIAHPIGPALVWTPLIWIAEAGAVVADLFGANIALHGYTLWHQRIVFLSSALFACGAVLLGAMVARRLLGTRWAPTYGAVAVLLGTSVTYYATFMPSYAHAMDAFFCAAFLGYWALTVGRRDVRRWVILGALLGLATLVRVQELAFGVVVAIEVVAGVVRDRRLGWLVGGAIALAVAIVVFSPQLLEWRLVFGKVTELPQGAKYTRLEAPMIAEVLFAPRNGWFSTTPIAYAGVIGLFCLPKRARLVAIGLVAAVAIQVYLNSTILDWWGGAAFGQRRLCNVTLPLVVGIAALLWRLGRVRIPRWVKHALAATVFGGLVAYNLSQVGRYASGNAASSELSKACCDEIPRPLRGIARAIYGAIGDPFEFPANAVFAIRHGVPIQRWDETVGDYPFVPALDSLLDDRLWAQHGIWHLGAAGMERFFVAGFGKSELKGRPVRFTTSPRATALVPNLMPYGQHATLWLIGTGHAKILWNDHPVAEADLTGPWRPVEFDLPAIELHTNELTVEAGAGSIGVADLELRFLPRSDMSPQGIQ